MSLNSPPLVKVDSICTAEDVASFRRLGVNFLGIPVVDPADLSWIRRIVGDDFSDVCYRFDLSEIAQDKCTDICQRHGPAAVDFVGHLVPDKSTCATFVSERLPVFFSNIDASHDTDPSWILSRYHELLGLENTFVQIDLFEEFEDGWSVLCQAAETGDELTVKDIDDLSKNQGIFLNLNFTTSNFAEIQSMLPHVRGATFSLEQQSSGQQRLGRSYTRQQIEDLIRFDHLRRFEH